MNVNMHICTDGDSKCDPYVFKHFMPIHTAHHATILSGKDTNCVLNMCFFFIIFL
jgi:hypothetical protein